jgi:hypothetical protein
MLSQTLLNMHGSLYFSWFFVSAVFSYMLALTFIFIITSGFVLKYLQVSLALKLPPFSCYLFVTPVVFAALLAQVMCGLWDCQAVRLAYLSQTLLAFAHQLLVGVIKKITSPALSCPSPFNVLYDHLIDEPHGLV